MLKLESAAQVRTGDTVGGLVVDGVEVGPYAVTIRFLSNEFEELQGSVVIPNEFSDLAVLREFGDEREMRAYLSRYVDVPAGCERVEIRKLDVGDVLVSGSELPDIQIESVQFKAGKIILTPKDGKRLPGRDPYELAVRRI